MLQMAWNEGYRPDNPVMTIELKQVPTKPVLVATHAQWNRLEGALPFRAALVYARLNVTTWARQCEMRPLRPRDFEFGSTTMTNITRSASYVTADNHPEGHAGWVVQPNAKNGDWRRFAISAPMARMIREHIEEHEIANEDLLFPLWMFTFRRVSTGLTVVAGEEMAPPLVSPTGKVYEHGTMGARRGDLVLAVVGVGGPAGLGQVPVAVIGVLGYGPADGGTGPANVCSFCAS